MKYVITGSLGHISKPIVQELLAAGHKVSVISSREENAGLITDLGAAALIGSLEDRTFVENSFEETEAAYLMIPQNFAASDFYAYQQQVADNYIAAITKHKIKYVVQLSSIGAHLRQASGPIDGLGYLEEELGKLEETNVLMLRPSFFFYNLFGQADMVKQAGIFGSNFGGEEKLVLADTADIAEEAVQALLNLSFTGHSVKYISSDERTTDEIASVLGEAIGKPGTPWVVLSDEQSLQGMIGGGVPKPMAESYTQMGKSIREGLIQEDYWKNKPTPTKKHTLETFAKSFAGAFKA